MADISRVPLSTANDKELNDIYRRVTGNAAANKALDAKKIKACDTTPDGTITDGAEEEALLTYLGTLGSSITVYDENNVPTQFHTSTVDGKVTITAAGIVASAVIGGKTVVVEQAEAGENAVQMVPLQYLAAGQVLTPLEAQYSLMRNKLVVSLELEAAKLSVSSGKIPKQKNADNNGTVTLVDWTDEELVKEQEKLIIQEAVVTDEDITLSVGDRVINFEEMDEMTKQLLPLKQQMKLAEWRGSLEDSAVIYDPALKRCREIFGKITAHEQLRQIVAAGADLSKLSRETIAKLAKMLGKAPEELKKLDNSGLNALVQEKKNELLAMFEAMKKGDNDGVTPAQRGYLMVLIARGLNLDAGWTEKRVAEAAGDATVKFAMEDKRARLGYSVDPYLAFMLADIRAVLGYSLAEDGTVTVDKAVLDEEIAILRNNLKTFGAKKDNKAINAMVCMLLAKYLKVTEFLVGRRDDALLLTGETKKQYEAKIIRLSNFAESLKDLITNNFSIAAEYELTRNPLSDDETVRTGQTIKLGSSPALISLMSILKAMAETREPEAAGVQVRNFVNWKAGIEEISGWIKTVAEDTNIPEGNKLETLEQRLTARGNELVTEAQTASQARFAVIAPEIEKIKIKLDLINDFKKNVGSIPAKGGVMDGLGKFAKARAALYGDIITAITALNNDLKSKMDAVVIKVEKAAIERIDRKIELAEEGGRLEELKAIGNSRKIGGLSYKALVAAVRVAAKAGDRKELVLLGDVMLARAGESDNMEIGEAFSAGALDAYKKAMPLNKNTDDKRALGYRMLQLKKYDLAKVLFTDARKHNPNLANDNMIDEEILICSEHNALTSNPTGIDVKDCTLLSKAEIYGALKSVNADVSKLTEDDVVTAVKKVYRRNGYRASCIASYDSAKNTWVIYVTERRITKVSVESENPVKMNAGTILGYFPGQGELVDESKVREGINNLLKCNKEVFTSCEYEVREGANGPEVVIKVEEPQKDGLVNTSANVDQKGNASVSVSTGIKDWSGTGKPFKGTASVGGMQDSVSNKRFIGAGLQSELPLSNTTSLIAGYTQDLTAGRPYDYRGGIKQQWSSYLSSTHTVGYKQRGERQVMNTEHDLIINCTRIDLRNSFTPVGGHETALSGEAGKVANRNGDPYYRGEVTCNQYLGVLSELLGNRLVLNVRETVGAGSNLDSDTRFRTEYNDAVKGDMVVGGRTELGLSLERLEIPKIKVDLPVVKWLTTGINWVLIAPVNLLVKNIPLQPFAYAEGATTPTYGQRRFDGNNSAYRGGAGLRVKIPVIGLLGSVYYDSFNNRWQFNLGK